LAIDRSSSKEENSPKLCHLQPSSTEAARPTNCHASAGSLFDKVPIWSKCRGFCRTLLHPWSEGKIFGVSVYMQCEQRCSFGACFIYVGALFCNRCWTLYVSVWKVLSVHVWQRQNFRTNQLGPSRSVESSSKLPSEVLCWLRSAMEIYCWRSPLVGKLVGALGLIGQTKSEKNLWEVTIVFCRDCIKSDWGGGKLSAGNLHLRWWKHAGPFVPLAFFIRPLIYNYSASKSVSGWENYPT
jgi:hypothetical protein